MNIFQRIFCILTWYLIWPFFKILTGFKIKKPADLKLSKPIIITANHPSLLDPFLIGLCFSSWHPIQPIYFMTADGLMKSPIGPLLKLWGAFPVNRGQGLEHALKMPQELLNQKQAILIFPQGKRVSDNNEKRVKVGAAVLALRNQLPVLPIKIIDPFPNKLIKLFLSKRKIKIIIGQPYYLNPTEKSFKEDCLKAAKIIFKKIDQLE